MKVEGLRKLKVTYNGKPVGILYQDDLTVYFQYDREWLRNGFSISPLSLPLREGVFESNNRYLDSLFGVFADSLPEGWGENLSLRYLGENGIAYNKLLAVQRLALTRPDGLGTLEYSPNQAVVEDFQIPNLDELASDFAKLINREPVDLGRLYAYGGSSGGTRPKVHVEIDGEPWIVKFIDLMDGEDAGYEEYLANVAARECGIHVADFKLIPSKNGGGYFASRRFDREGDRRIHVVSMSALLETSHRLMNLDYRMLFSLIQKISIDKEDLYEAFKRMAFNVFYGNKDDHGKNFSFVYDERRGGYLLSPAYDLTRTEGLKEHSMSVLGKRNPSEGDMLELASKFHLSKPRCLAILEKVKTVCRR